jgi:hypothetical protein
MKLLVSRSLPRSLIRTNEVFAPSQKSCPYCALPKVGTGCSQAPACRDVAAEARGDGELFATLALSISRLRVSTSRSVMY